MPGPCADSGETQQEGAMGAGRQGRLPEVRLGRRGRVRAKEEHPGRGRTGGGAQWASVAGEAGRGWSTLRVH